MLFHIFFTMKFTSNRDVAISVENLSFAVDFYENFLGYNPVKFDQIIEYTKLGTSNSMLKKETLIHQLNIE